MEREKIKTRLILWYSIFLILLAAALYLGYAVYFTDTTSTKSKWIILFSSSVTLLFGICKFLEISYYKYKDDVIKKLIKDNIDLHNIFRRIRNFITFAFFAIPVFLLRKHLSTDFTICCGIGILLYFVSSKISSYSLINGKIKAKDAISTQFISLKLNFSSDIISTIAYLSVFSIGIVILFHIFKDYEAIISYTFGYCCASFFDNAVRMIFDSGVKYVSKLANRYKKSKTIAKIEQFKNAFYKTPSLYIEFYAIAIVSAVATGACTLNLMGAFLPFIISANSMFALIFTLLFSKINKKNNIFANILKRILFISLITSVATIFEVYLWLGKNFIAIGYSVALGLICSVVAFCFFEKSTKRQNISSNVSNISANLLLALFLLVCVFLISDGMNSVLYAFYNITAAVLSYALNGFIISIYQDSEQIKKNIKNYKNTSCILLCISTLLAFCVITSLEVIDIANPIALASIFLGIALTLILFNIILYAVKNQKRAMFQLFKSETRLKDTIITSCIINMMYLGFIVSMLMLLQYFLYKHSSLDILFCFVLGIFITSIIFLYANDKAAKSASASILRLTSIIFLVITFLFI